RAFACTYDGISFEELAPRNFSFNSPYGACPTCDGLGTRLEVDADLVVPDTGLSINEGALAPWASSNLEYWYRVLDAVADSNGFDLDTPWKRLGRKARQVVLYGSDEEVYVRYKNRYGRQRAYYTTYEGVILVDVGLDYLSLDRPSATLAGGEAQRIRLATQIGSGLVGVLYILDEPSIGLHQRDNRRLLDTLVRLRDLGNTLIVVEHDEATILAADHIVDIGPGAGEHGGEIVYSGELK